MKTAGMVQCTDFPCLDTRRAGYLIPAVEIDPPPSKSCSSPKPPRKPRRLLLCRGQMPSSPAPPCWPSRMPGQRCSMQDILDLGVYLTTAVKCAKTGPGLATATIQNCSHLLEKELALFPNVKVYLLMGDVAIQAVNLIAKRNQQPRVIPAGSTYKIRGGEFTFRGARAFPSYVQAGPAFFVEKSKRRMIAEDIRNALLIAD